jgi:hypothetical protein
MDDTRVAKLDSLLIKLENVFEATTYTLENISAEIETLRQELTSIKKAFRKVPPVDSGSRQLRPLRKSG